MGIADTVDLDVARFALLDADAMSGVASATYTNSTGTTRSIRAQVLRMPTQGAYTAGDIRPKLEVHVANSSTYGISATELRPGQDTLTVPLKPGGTAEAFVIRLPADGREWADAGMLRLWLE